MTRCASLDSRLRGNDVGLGESRRTPLAPLDSCLRRNDAGAGEWRRSAVWLAGRRQHNTPHSSPEATTTPVTGLVAAFRPSSWAVAGTVVEPCVGGSVHPARDRFCIQLYFVVVERSGAHSPSRRDDVSFVFAGAAPAVAVVGAYLLLYNMCCGKVKWGMEGDGGIGDGPVPAAPGIPLRSRFARPRPPYAGAKGDGVDACLRKWGKAGSSAAHRPRPGHTPRASLRLHAPLSLGAKGAGAFACLRKWWRSGPAPSRPPRASPCGLAPLARVPLTLTRRGTVWILRYCSGWTFRPLKRLPARE